MIAELEIRRQARLWGVEPTVVDLDYTLGWFLHGLFAHSSLAGKLVFKGGTCLRKCYFTDYRFSEDLDFTLLQYVGPDELEAGLEQLREYLTYQGFNFPRPMRIEWIDDEYGKESLQARIYYRAALQQRSEPRAIRLDLSRDETLCFPPESRLILHPYPDSTAISDSPITCYSFAEMMAEKLRAICGQRVYAIARDIFDLAQLVASGTDLEQVLQAIPQKFLQKGLYISPQILSRFESRRYDFSVDWNRTVAYLVGPAGAMGFDEAWQRVLPLVHRVSALAG